MLIDRLQALEERVQQQDVVIKMLKMRTDELSSAVHFRLDALKFSDGWCLIPGMTRDIDRIYDNTNGFTPTVQVDDLHLGAIAFHGAMQIEVFSGLDPVDVGNDPKEPVTVGHLLSGINTWCTKHLPRWDK